MKKLLLLLIPTVVLAAHHHTKSIRYSAIGNYLVNQDGERIVIQGHPHMICFVGRNEQINGKFVKTRDGLKIIYIRGWSKMSGNHKLHDFAIPNPVCDLE